ncbi:MAG: hypothetical protein M3Y65_05130 [Pseudomonadota bacterium]|nr:hypothetical protein [Pseudomonadota bacterium]
MRAGLSRARQAGPSSRWTSTQQTTGAANAAGCSSNNAFPLAPVHPSSERSGPRSNRKTHAHTVPARGYWNYTYLVRLFEALLLRTETRLDFGNIFEIAKKGA